MNGTVLHFKNTYGHIAPDDHSTDLFAHHSDVLGLARLKSGDRVSFEIGARHGRQIAVNIKIVKAAPKPEHIPTPPKRDYLTDYVALNGPAPGPLYMPRRRCVPIFQSRKLGLPPL